MGHLKPGLPIFGHTLGSQGTDFRHLGPGAIHQGSICFNYERDANPGELLADTLHTVAEDNLCNLVFFAFLHESNDSIVNLPDDTGLQALCPKVLQVIGEGLQQNVECGTLDAAVATPSDK